MTEINSEITAEGQIDIVNELDQDVEDLNTRDIIDAVLSKFADKYPEAGISFFQIEHTGEGGIYTYEIVAEDGL